MQSKAPRHFIPTRMAMIKNTDVGKEVEKLGPSYIAGGNATLESRVAVPQKVRYHLIQQFYS